MRKVLSRAYRNFGKSDRDFVALGIASAAIVLFVGTGGAVLRQTVASWHGIGEGPDKLLVQALLLNIALILLGWRRYTELTEEIETSREAEQQARLLSELDPLTDCLNRRSLIPATDALMADCAARGNALAMMMIDLDNFKQINDLNGHKMGDQVLQKTAKRIQAAIPRGGLLARLGGDEFACAFAFDPQLSDSVDAIAIRIIESVSYPLEISGCTVEVTPSVGIAGSNNGNGETGRNGDANDLMHRADIAMYHAKKQGKCRYFWFETTMEQELRFRSELIQGVRQGIEKGEFVPFYEQQIDLETGDLAGFEMLARWKSPEFGLVGPDVFIPIAEDIGVISALFESLMTQAFADARQWHSDLTLSVNVSSIQMRDPWFSQKLLRLLVQHSFPPGRLEIEISEDCLRESSGMVRSLITSLRNQGVKVCLDDFGTGNASLSQLRTMPFDRLKIDRHFVKDLKTRASGAKLVQAILSLGEGLKMPLAAEGIEDEEILALMKSLGSIKGQGYHYGKPEDAATVHERLAASGRLARADEPSPAMSAPARSDPLDPALGGAT